MTAPMLVRIIRAAAPCVATLVAGLASAPPAAAQSAADKVTFQDHVLPVFRNACNNCHNPDKKKAGLDLTTYSGALAGGDNGSVTNAGDPAGSMLYKVMTHAAEPTMPPKRDKLPQAELEVVRKWIAGGLLENAAGKAAAPTKPKVDLGTVVIAGKPTGPVAFPKDLASEPLVHTARPGAVEALAASPWAPVVAVGGQKQIVLYHAGTLDVVGVLPFGEGVPRVLRFSRNGSLLLAAGGQGAKLGKVVLFDVASGERAAEVGDETDEVLAADLSPDQKLVALGGPSRVIRAYDVADGKEVYALKKHTDWVTAVAISPSGEYLATGDRAGNLYVWEAKTGGELYNLAGHKDAIHAVAFRGDSGVLMSASKDGTVKLWEMAEGKQVKTFDAHRGGTTSAAFTHDGRIVTTGKDKTVKVWDSTGGSPKPLAPGLTDLPMHATFDDEGKRVFAGDWSGVVRVWQVADGKPVGELTPNPPRIAERLEVATKKLADAEPAIAKAEGELKAVQAAAERAAEEHKKVLAAIDAAKQAAVGHEVRAKAGPEAVAAARKAAAVAAEGAAAKEKAVAGRRQAVAEAEKSAKAEMVGVADANTNAAVDVKPLEADLKAKERSLDEAAKALAAADKAAADKPDDESAKQVLADARARVGRRTARVDLARRALDQAKVQKPAPTAAPEAEPQAEAVARGEAVAKAKAGLAQAEREAATARQAADEAAKAVEKLQAEVTAATEALAKVKADLAAAEKQVKPAADAAKAAADKVGPVQKAFDEARAAAVAARYDVAKLRAAGAGTTLAEARKALKGREAERTAAEGAAKEAVAAVEKAKADVAAFAKARQESPAKVKQIADGLPALRKKLADATGPADAAAKDAGDRDLLAAEAAAVLKKIGEQAAKSKDNKAMAEAESAAKKVVEHLSADLAAAKDQSAKLAEARKAAETELASAEGAIAKERADTENAAKISEGLMKALANAEAAVPTKRAAAEAAARPVEEAKAKVEQVKGEYERLSAEAQKLAPATVVSKG